MFDETNINNMFFFFLMTHQLNSWLRFRQSNRNRIRIRLFTDSTESIARATISLGFYCFGEYRLIGSMLIHRLFVVVRLVACFDVKRVAVVYQLRVQVDILINIVG